MNIKEKIILHYNLYNAAYCIIPPYRLTCKEHKELIDLIGQNKKGIIARFHDVELEIVMLIDAYD